MRYSAHTAIYKTPTSFQGKVSGYCGINRTNVLFAARGKQLVWNSDTLSPGSCHQPRFSLLKNYQRIKTGTKLPAIVVVVIMFYIYNFFVGRNNVIGGKAMPVENPSLIGPALVNQNANSAFDENVKTAVDMDIVHGH